jgi:hypothetical protein
MRGSFRDSLTVGHFPFAFGPSLLFRIGRYRAGCLHGQWGRRRQVYGCAYQGQRRLVLGQLYRINIRHGPDRQPSPSVQANYCISRRSGGDGCRGASFRSRWWRPFPRRNSHMGFDMRRSSHRRIARYTFLPTSAVKVAVRSGRLTLLRQTSIGRLDRPA